ncbi:MAG: phosphoribosylformylglycinamidine cyclo-ligase [Clostridiales Family XIII bacterium]|jgi:phosphoribosylformylglycinamidine cyclo-ligase|nr:phosphoribosylformylglycinamidine cyclo-ligase [Clostridiales Family XIII bacterium]
MTKKNLRYKDAGVDTIEGQRAISLMKKYVKKTFNKNVLTDLGSFAGLYSLNLKNIKNPVIVSGTDGVGTKLKLAFDMEKHDTVGEDAVAMCVNDILCQGAKPLFFLDYIATGKIEAEKIATIVKGIARGCKKANAALIGGETAEMPDFYKNGEYDIAGFAVGIVDRRKIITGDKIKNGDIIIGIPSSGVHSNGYSLVRKILKINKIKLSKKIDKNKTIGELLLKPTKIYTKEILPLLEKFTIDGLVHITGGGYLENVPRIMPDNLTAIIDKSKFNRRKIFTILKKLGNIEEEEMFKTFNMGYGMLIFASKKDAENIIIEIKKTKGNAKIIGKVEKGHDKIKFI